MGKNLKIVIPFLLGTGVLLSTSPALQPLNADKAVEVQAKAQSTALISAEIKKDKKNRPNSNEERRDEAETLFGNKKVTLVKGVVYIKSGKQKKIANVSSTALGYKNKKLDISLKGGRIYLKNKPFYGQVLSSYSYPTKTITFSVVDGYTQGIQVLDAEKKSRWDWFNLFK